MTEEMKSSDLPTQPPSEIIRWAEEKILGNLHSLVYRAGWYKDPLTDLRENCVDADGRQRCRSCVPEGAPTDMLQLRLASRISTVSP